MDDAVSVTVRGIAAGGAGVADLPDGRVVFVPRTAPGDRARIRIGKSRPRWAEGSLEELVEPAAERRPSLCALYDRCGGCQLQHLPYARQLESKARVVADALERIGRLQGIEPPEVVGSPRETGYRSRVTFTLRRLRGGRVVAGFHELDRPTRVLDVADECVLPRPALVDAWQALRAAWGEGARLLPAGGRLRLTLRAEADGIALVVEGGARGWRAAELAAAARSIDRVWHRADSVEVPELVAGETSGTAPSFAQVNPEAATLLVEHVLALVGPADGASGGAPSVVGRDGAAAPDGGQGDAPHAVDAYCGEGVYARGLVALGWRVTGIELDAAAVAAARAGAGEGGPERFDVLQGAVEERLREALPADLVVVNPPRAGLDAEVVRQLAEWRPERIVYVSCDPATLARDVAGLSAAYTLTSIRCFDLFPQTAHVETVVALRAREG